MTDRNHPVTLQDLEEKLKEVLGLIEEKKLYVARNVPLKQDFSLENLIEEVDITMEGLKKLRQGQAGQKPITTKVLDQALGNYLHDYYVKNLFQGSQLESSAASKRNALVNKPAGKDALGASEK